MRIVGIVTVIVGAAVVLFILFVGVRSIPDVRRYKKMRDM